MQFRALEEAKVMMYATQYCGDGCCSWDEREVEWVHTNELFEPEFGFASLRTDEECFRNDVEAGVFVPVDEEAKQWCEVKV